MAFFRTINFSEPLPSVVGEGVMLRTPQMTDYGDWAALREAKPRISHAMGADVAGRRLSAAAPFAAGSGAMPRICGPTRAMPS